MASRIWKKSEVNTAVKSIKEQLEAHNVPVEIKQDKDTVKVTAKGQDLFKALRGSQGTWLVRYPDDLFA